MNLLSVRVRSYSASLQPQQPTICIIGAIESKLQKHIILKESELLVPISDKVFPDSR